MRGTAVYLRYIARNDLPVFDTSWTTAAPTVPEAPVIRIIGSFLQCAISCRDVLRVVARARLNMTQATAFLALAPPFPTTPVSS